MKTFEVKILSMDKMFYAGKCRQLIINAVDGLMGILANHENSVIVLVEGLLRVQLEDESWLEAVTGAGHVRVENNQVTVLVEFAEKPEEIDELRARRALERAQEALRQKQSIQEYHMSQANIARAMARLAVKQRYTKRG